MFVLLLTLPTAAGDLKLHKPWPAAKTPPPPQDVTSIDIVLDLGYYLWIKNEDALKVSQTTINNSNPFFTYSGCALTDVVSNFSALLKGTVEATSPAQGQWSATLNGYSELSVDRGTTPVQICVLGEHVATHMLVGPEPKENVKVAELTINIMPDFFQN